MLFVPPAPEVVAARVDAVRQQIQAAGRTPADVRIVAVTKGFTEAAVQAALAAGIPDIGENYAGELLAKANQGAQGAVTWHYLGAIQRRKVPSLAPVVSIWQGVCRQAEGEAIAAHSPGATVLVQVDVTGLPGRHGCAPGDTGVLVKDLQRLGLDVRGLMAVGAPGGPEAARPGFRLLRQLADETGLPELSMGMSDDLEAALAEGSTMLRVGRTLFGPRPRRP